MMILKNKLSGSAGSARQGLSDPTVFVVAPEIVVKEAGQAIPESTRPLAQLMPGSIRLGPTCI